MRDNPGAAAKRAFFDFPSHSSAKIADREIAEQEFSSVMQNPDGLINKHMTICVEEVADNMVCNDSIK